MTTSRTAWKYCWAALLIGVLLPVSTAYSSFPSGWKWWQQPPMETIENTYFGQIAAERGRMRSSLIYFMDIINTWWEPLYPSQISGSIVNETLYLNTAYMYDPTGLLMIISFEPAPVHRGPGAGLFTSEAEVEVWVDGETEPNQVMPVRLVGYLKLHEGRYYLTARTSGVQFWDRTFGEGEGAYTQQVVSFFNLNLSGDAEVGNPFFAFSDPSEDL